MTSSQKIVWFVVGILVLIIIVVGFSFSKQAQAPQVTETQTDNSIPAPVTIDVKHQFVNGTHTVAGSVDLPSPCHTLQTTASVDSTRNTATIQFVVASSSNVCAQVITSKTFKVQFKGANDMNIVGTFNGKPVNLNIFEVPANENIDTFQIYTKG